MIWRIMILLLLCVLNTVNSQQSLASKMMSHIHIAHVVGMGDTYTKSNLKVLENQKKLQPHIPASENFPCKTEGFRSPSRPTSVHKLRPGDIDAVAAIGDSIIAGNGAVASNLYQVMLENMGVSFSMGGQGDWKKYLTLPNILKEFNPNLKGFSLGSNVRNSKKIGFNLAVGGAYDEMLPKMAEDLVKQMKEDKSIDFENDWKVVTVLSGANNLCNKMCMFIFQTQSETDIHKSMLQLTLDYLQKHLPRTIVNLISVENVASLKELKNRPIGCEVIKYFECPCFFSINPLLVMLQSFMGRIVKDFHEAEDSLIQSGRYDKTDNFTVVIQPFFRDMNVPSVKTESGSLTDYTYLTHDCFHFSQKGHARAANALWNNMMEPVGNKSLIAEELFKTFICPSEETPYIFTNVNSKKFRDTGKQ